MINQLEVLLDKINSSSGFVSNDLVESARRFVKAALEASRRGDDRSRDEHLDELAHQVSEMWPYDSPLGLDILTYVQAHRRAGKQRE